MKSGTVYIVGAGPGDPDLMTVKARRRMNEADVVLYDSLVGDEITDEVPDDVRAIGVGKKPGGERTPQMEINRLMVSEAERGNDVVRLKGGDPNVFGRGGEEAEHLAANGVDFEVVPGVSSVSATGVYGIPLTHREHSSSFTVVTGHEDPTKEESALDWGALAANVDAGGTLVVLMGVGRLPDNVDALVRNGLDADTPAAMVEKATLDSHVVTGTLDGIVERARDAGVEPPAITVFGDVIDVRERVVEVISSASVRAPKELVVGERG